MAILLVFLFHCHLFFFDPDAKGNQGTLSHFSIRNLLIVLSPSSVGWIGVLLFFIVSGFLIHLGFVRNPENFTLSAFFSKRFWRIYPPYWLTLIALILIQLFSGSGINKTNAVLHMLTIYNGSDKYFYSYNPSYWSLATEIQLYLLYPLLLLVRKKIGIANCFILICAVSMLSLVLGIIFSDFGTTYAYHYNPFQLWFVWAAGAWYAEAIYTKQLRLFKKNGLVWCVVFYLVLIISTLFTPTGHFVFFIATGACVAVFEWVLYTSFINTSKLPAKLLIVTGLCSYSFYLVHQPYLDRLLTFFGASTASSMRLLTVLPVFVSILSVSYLLYKTIELPSIQLGKSLRNK